MQYFKQSFRPSLLAFCSVLVLTLSGCSSPAPGTTAEKTPAPQKNKVVEPPKASVTHSPFGKLPDGTNIEQFTLTNASGSEVRIINYGGIVTALKVPDRDGKLADVVLGYDTFDNYIKNPTFFGAIIGRFANRIAKGTFKLDGKTYDKLALNNKPNTLHGGLKGFDKVVWQAEPLVKADAAGVVLTYISPDGEEGYPGTLTTRVIYAFNNANELSVDYTATTDKATVVNYTSHSYFNLGGDGSGDVLSHQLMINADRYTPTDATGIPLGKLASVAGTTLDFRTSIPIGTHIEAEHKVGLGYDYNFVINRPANDQGKDLVLAARVQEPKTGRILEVRTTEPGIQLYTANHMDGSLIGKAGHAYNKHNAFCLETQHFPDSPNQRSFPTTTLKPGETFHSQTVYAFSAK